MEICRLGGDIYREVSSNCYCYFYCCCYYLLFIVYYLLFNVYCSCSVNIREYRVRRERKKERKHTQQTQQTNTARQGEKSDLAPITLFVFALFHLGIREKYGHPPVFTPPADPPTVGHVHRVSCKQDTQVKGNRKRDLNR